MYEGINVMLLLLLLWVVGLLGVVIYGAIVYGLPGMAPLL